MFGNALMENKNDPLIIYKIRSFIKLNITFTKEKAVTKISLRKETVANLLTN